MECNGSQQPSGVVESQLRQAGLNWSAPAGAIAGRIEGGSSRIKRAS